MIRRPPRSTPKPSSAASDVYKRQRQHFVTSGYNRSYFGVGENLAWAKWGGNTGIQGWAPYLQNLSSAGANYIRVWLTNGGWDDMAVETQLGNYSLANTDNIDELLTLAEALSIKVLMCTESFNHFCSKPKPTPCLWDKSCLLYTSPSPRDATLSRMPSSA